MNLDILVAISSDGTIGICQNGDYSIPWPKLANDMQYFRKMTTLINSHQKIAIIVGNNTWKSLPAIYKRNKSRFTIILSNQISASEPKNIGTENFCYVNSWDNALNILDNLDNIHKCFVIGGSSVYSYVLSSPRLKNIHLTLVDIDPTFPIINGNMTKIMWPLTMSSIVKLTNSFAITLEKTNSFYDSGVFYVINHYIVNDTYLNKYANIPKNNYSINHTNEINYHDENQYLSLIHKIKTSGKIKSTRNGQTSSIFGTSLKYNLSNGYPILTCKTSYPKSIFEELMWMIRGQTDASILKKKGVTIWSANSSTSFLAQQGLNYQEGDIGPGYGFQLRHFGANYIDCKTDYTGLGVDQLMNAIELLNNDPTSRRIIISLWNPCDIHKMALPPCHILYTFGVELYDDLINGKRGKLNCHLNQRSWDVLLGWNTTTAALLTFILAHHTDLDVGLLYHTITDAHIYQTHFVTGNVNKLLDRIPRNSPKLVIKNKHNTIEDYEYDDIDLIGYVPHPPISFTMVA